MINLTMQAQPNDETCGPTCLQAIYNYYGLTTDLDQVIHGVERSLSGGTLAPFLGTHALSLDFTTTIYINNLDIFDPSWFNHQGDAKVDLIAKLQAQMQHKQNPGIIQSSLAYQHYLKNGGSVRFRTINTRLLKTFFDKKIPILTGLSATYLYRCARERFTPEGKSVYDDIQGTPCGHFVVLCGYDDLNRRVVVADPHKENPLIHEKYYKVSSNRIINAIMLGVLTYDANLLIIQPKES
jgi:hypothetical protein